MLFFTITSLVLPNLVVGIAGYLIGRGVTAIQRCHTELGQMIEETARECIAMQACAGKTTFDSEKSLEGMVDNAIPMEVIVKIKRRPSH